MLCTAANSFNPRARVGRDEREPDELLHDGVSIHAPAWGATFASASAISPADVSIHAPAWGATRTH